MFVYVYNYFLVFTTEIYIMFEHSKVFRSHYSFVLFFLSSFFTLNKREMSQDLWILLKQKKNIFRHGTSYLYITSFLFCYHIYTAK